MGVRTGQACPACGTPIPGRSRREAAPRWCGGCGAALTGTSRTGAARTGAALTGAARTEPGEVEPHVDRPAGSGARRLPPVALAVALGGVLAVGALVALGVGGAGGPTAGGGGDLDVDLGREDVAAVANGPTAATGPVCLVAPDCVAWSEAASIAGRAPTATVVDDLVLVRVRDGLEAREVATGALRWRTELGDAAERRTYLSVATAGDLALLNDVDDEGSHLLAVELADGDVRWRVPDVDELRDARLVDEALLLRIVRPSTAPASTVSPPSATQRPEEVLAVGPADGELRWQLDGPHLRLVRDGVVAVDEEVVHLLGGDGQPRWSVPTGIETRPTGLRVVGRFALVTDTRQETGPALSLDDGAAASFDGDLVAIADLEVQDGSLYDGDVAALVERHPDGSTKLSLLDGDEVAWERTFVGIGCCAPPQLEGERFTVPAADGGRWVLDRRDGSLLERTPPSGELTTSYDSHPVRGDVTVVEAGPPSARSSELALVERGTTTARLPAGAWPVGVTDELVVLRGDGWVAGVRRTPEPTP